MISKSIQTLAILTAVGLFATSAMAQQGYPPEGSQGKRTQGFPGQQRQQQMNVPDHKMKQFVEVHKEVASIRGEYRQKIQNAGDQKKASELNQKANDKMVKAVEESPISIDEYNKLVSVIPRDPSLKQKFDKYMNR